MGCWNSTCILSNLSISAGQRVVVFPIWRNQLCLFPIRGEYNDYGALENVDPHPLQDFLFDRLESLRIPIDGQESFVDECKSAGEKVKEMESEDPSSKELLKASVQLYRRRAVAIDRQEKYTSLEDLVDDMERQDVRGDKIMLYDGFDQTFSGITFCMVLETVWDQVRDLYINDTSRHWYGHPHKSLDEHVEKFKADLIKHGESEVITDMVFMRIQNELNSRFNDFTKIVELNEKNYDAQLFDAHIDRSKEMSEFSGVLSYMRKSLVSDPMAGSQSDNHQFMEQAYQIFKSALSIPYESE